MKYITLAAITAFAVGAAVTAQAGNEQSPYGTAQPAHSDGKAEIVRTTGSEAGSSLASLNALLAEWDRAGFVAPSKPSQYRVYGRNGYVTSGPGYNIMVSLIRSVVKDTREGRGRDAATKITKARSLLIASNLRRE